MSKNVFLFKSQPETEKVPLTREERIEKMMIQEFGFSLIVEAILNKVQKTPIIGHNLMYDVLYFYAQFIGNLPETYLEFLAEWNKCFPVIFDSKVIAYYNQ